MLLPEAPGIGPRLYVCVHCEVAWNGTSRCWCCAGPGVRPPDIGSAGATLAYIITCTVKQNERMREVMQCRCRAVVDPSEPADLYCCQHGRLFRLGERGN